MLSEYYKTHQVDVKKYGLYEGREYKFFSVAENISRCKKILNVFVDTNAIYGPIKRAQVGPHKSKVWGEKEDKKQGERPPIPVVRSQWLSR